MHILIFSSRKLVDFPRNYKEHFDTKLKEDLLSTNDILRNMKSDLRKHIMSNKSNHTINCMLRCMTNLNIVEVSIKLHPS